MGKNEAIEILVQVAAAAQAKGALTLDEAALTVNAIKTLRLIQEAEAQAQREADEKAKKGASDKPAVPINNKR